MDGVLKDWQFHPLLDRCGKSGGQCGDCRVVAKQAMRLGWCNGCTSGPSVQARWSMTGARPIGSDRWHNFLQIVYRE
jgi:hypothetical protein